MYEFTENDKLTYKENKMLVIDNFLEKELAEKCQNEILLSDKSKWDRYNNCFEQKYTYKDKNNFPPSVKELYNYFTSSDFLYKLKDLTSLNLINETDRILWGIHLFENGDKLDIHVDAGRHIKTGFIKAITIGIYLSFNWNQENGGCLEFWHGDSCHIDSPEIKNCKSKFLPIFNRCVIFENNNYSWHGAPDPCICKNDEKRIFITLSYLIKEENDNFLNKRLKAYFVKRPSDPYDEEKDKMRLLRSNPNTCETIYNINK
jgi:Rps23 Pro-64 3,4-dihydroxylase Tpa1-like proline 4-hydroxylase